MGFFDNSDNSMVVDTLVVELEHIDSAHPGFSTIVHYKNPHTHSLTSAGCHMAVKSPVTSIYIAHPRQSL